MSASRAMYPDAGEFTSPSSTMSTPRLISDGAAAVRWGDFPARTKDWALKAPLLRVGARLPPGELRGREYLRYRLGLSNRTMFRLTVAAALLAGLLAGVLGAVGILELARVSEAPPRASPAGPLRVPPPGAWKHSRGLRRRLEVFGRAVWVYDPRATGSVAGAPWAQAPMPVLVVLHGSEDTPLDIANATRFEQIADEAGRGFLVVLPEMRVPAGMSWGYKDDETFFRAVVAKVAEQYAIRQDEVFVCGHSNGGTMALYLQNNMPDLFRAAAAVEAGVGHLEQWQNTSAGRPTLVVWNHNDNVLAQYGGEHLFQQTLSALLRRGASGGPPPVEEALGGGRWRRGKHGVLYAQRKTWPATDLQPMVQVVSWASAVPTHNWLNPVSIPGATLDASVLVWEFFQGVAASSQ